MLISPIYDVANKPQSNENNPMTWDKVLFKPALGTLIIFPSWVRHCVERQENNGPRISLAYNFDLCSEKPLKYTHKFLIKML